MLVDINACFFNFFIKCMQSMTMTLSRRCMYAKLHVTWSKSLLYIFSLINHIDSLRIQALKTVVYVNVIKEEIDCDMHAYR